ncbi:leucyl-tRNA synthetase, partial [Lentithecium fluviatile CBS 122367]
MFPYPSGTLHLGHLRVYTISDVLARFKRMQGYDVLHPIGWDAFGLPAENAAIERGVHPADWTLQNIEAMKQQMMEMGGRWSWDKEFRTCDPSFYKQTQRLFLMLYERGLAYQAESLVNWDPVDQTVLANEQVDANGHSWRSGAKVEQKMLKQWFLKIKEFQQPLLKDLDKLAENGRWPERVLAMQRNWIGRSVGTKLWFDLHKPGADESQPIPAAFDPVEVFTTRADTLLGVMYVALSLKHPIVQALAKEDEALRDFLERAKNFPPDSKEGYLLQGIEARNPIAEHVLDDTELAETVPIYVAPYVLDDYGSGAVMGVPAHDARDFAFWRQNQGTPVRRVIVAEPNTTPTSNPTPRDCETDKPMLEKGYVVSPDSGFNNLPSDQAIEAVVDRLQNNGKPVERSEHWRLRDWLVSRQRYWGTPIPIVHCSSCGPVPVLDNHLPVKLPDLPASYFHGKTGNPLAEDNEWKTTTCPKCKGPAERETDTMDTFMDSSWYFFRFLDPHDDNALVKPAIADKGMPVDVYVGGVEHAILHLLYARFISKFLATTKLWPSGSDVLGEPFKQLITQGMVHGRTYSDPATGRFLRPEEVDLSDESKPVIRGTDMAPRVSYEKMSKSKYNGVDPGVTIAKYGADATRAHMLFQAPISDVLEWDEQKITGVQRWLSKVLKLSQAFWWPEKELQKGFRPSHKLDIKVVTLLAKLREYGYLEAAPELRNKPFPYKTMEEELVAALKHSDAELLSKIQETIVSVTKSYSETYSLNTIISDLMTLTNTIWDTPHASICTPWFKWYATMHLLRMLAPIAPGVAEEGWHILHGKTNHNARDDGRNPLRAYTEAGAGPSIFIFGFPKADVNVLPLLNPKRVCVVQFDGKKKFETTIKPVPNSIPNVDSRGIQKCVLEQVLDTELGQKYFGALAGTWGVEWPLSVGQVFSAMPLGWSVRVVNRGQVINFVGPKK